MADNEKLQLMLAFLLDKKAQGELDKGIQQLEDKFGELDDTDFDQLAKAMDNINQKLLEQQERYRVLQDAADEYNLVAKKSEEIAKAFDKMSLAGAGVVGGIFAAANKYVKDAKEATKTTEEWKAAMGYVSHNTERVGKVLAEVALPFLKDAARVTGQIAEFIEQHPGLIKAAIGFGSAAAAIGAIGSVTLRAISAFAKVGALISGAQLTAAKVMDRASNKMLLASGQLSKGGPLSKLLGKLLTTLGVGGAAGGAAGGGLAVGGVSIGAIAAAVLPVIAAVGAGAILGAFGADKIAQATGQQRVGVTLSGIGYRLQKFAGKVSGMSEQEAEASAQKFALYVGKTLGVVEEGTGLWDQLKQAITGANDELEKYTAEQNKAASVDVLVGLQQQLNELDRDYAEKRAEVLQDAASKIQASTERYLAALEQIRTNLALRLEQLAADFEQANQRAQENYEQNREQIIRDQEERIRQIRKDAAEQLEELEYQHGLRMQDLAAARDALGIVKERERYRHEKKRLDEQTKDQIDEVRRQAAIRLKELERQFLIEQQRRREDYERQVAEARAQAARQEEELKAQHEAELAEIQKAKEEQLEDLKRAHLRERREKIQAAYDQLKDLGDALAAERLLRYQYSEAILTDTSAFVERMREYFSSLYDQFNEPPPSESGTPTRQAGGYSAGDRLHRLHEGEYVLNRETTQAAERLVGGKLSQGTILDLLKGGKSIVYQDNRRISAELSPRQIKEIADMTIDALSGALA